MNKYGYRTEEEKVIGENLGAEKINMIGFLILGAGSLIAIPAFSQDGAIMAALVGTLSILKSLEKFYITHNQDKAWSFLRKSTSTKSLKYQEVALVSKDLTDYQNLSIRDIQSKVAKIRKLTSVDSFGNPINKL